MSKRSQSVFTWIFTIAFCLFTTSLWGLELVRQKNAATVISFPLVGSSDDVAFTDCTTGADTEISTWTDGTTGPSAYTDATNEIALVSSATGVHWVSLTASEMNADYIGVLVKSTSCNPQFLLIRTQVGDPLYNAVTDDGTAINVASGAVDAAVTSIASNAITNATIATDAIGADEIATNAINANKIATDAIGADEIAASAIGSSEIATGAIDADAIAADAITNSEISTAAAEEIADVVWDEALAGHAGAGTAGAALSAAGDPWGTAVPGAYGAGTAGYKVGTYLDAAVSTRLATSGYTAPLDAAGTRTAVGLASANLDTQLSAIDDYVDAEVAAVKAVTDKLDTALELDGAVYRYTTNALEQAPGSATDPWGVSLPGAYTSGEAGYILGNLLDSLSEAHGPGPWVK